MCTKCNYLIIGILLIIIGILCGYILFNNQDSKNTTTNTNTNETAKTTVTNNDYSYNTISGFYTFQEKNPNNEHREELSSFNYGLYLSENGTFRYQFLMNTVSSIMGNYIIIDDEVRLNYLFVGGNDASISATSGSQILKIKDKDTLIDNNAHFHNQGGSSTINLTRDDNSDYYDKKEFDLNHIINHYGLFNNADTTH